MPLMFLINSAHMTIVLSWLHEIVWNVGSFCIGVGSNFIRVQRKYDTTEFLYIYEL